MKSRITKWPATVALTLLFLGLFFGLRSIPVSQCQFLHYEPVETANATETELCSVAPLPFVDVAANPFPVKLQMHSMSAGEDQEVKMRFSLLAPDGSYLLPHDLAITHTRKIHLMLIDEQLGSYHHLHPDPIGDSGDYEVRFVPRSAQYRFFAEFVPLRTRLLAVADGVFEVNPSNVVTVEDTMPIHFALQGIEKPLRPNRDHRLVLQLESEDESKALPLEKTMDAYAHLVGFEDSLSGYAHMHPMTVDPTISNTAEMEFLFHPTRSGNFRIWVQVRAEGKDIFRPFDVQVL